MSNSFNALPVWLDTDTSTGANTNWRGSSGCTLAGIGNRGIKPTRLMMLPANTGVAIAAGTITVLTGPGFADNVCLRFTGPCSKSLALEASMVSPLRPLRVVVSCLLTLSSLALVSNAQNVTTWHNDNNRTGWQPVETALKPSTV